MVFSIIALMEVDKLIISVTMRWALTLAVLGVGSLMASAPTHRVKPPSNSSASKSKSAKVKSVRSARGHGKASGRAVRVPPPSYQLHPDPERYQQIQQALADRGYFKGEANGTWSDDSTDALRKFQADQKLPDDGKITALSLTALGLGPRHDGSTASTVPVQPPPSDGFPSPAAPQNAEPPESLHR
jgi:peptidoglycan hydrolase-like protein with peptidoglycan-binding domain